ncbi:MAG TPA: thiolase family protein [Desulfatiglandales bacterium]|nr:thiolase family protein [Desulfatiglandales bacterium]
MPHHLKDKYAIVGVGYTPQGKIGGRTALSFHLESCVNAINDAGLKKEDIDGLILYRHFSPLLGEPEVTPYLLAQHLGISPNILSQEANCARGHLLHAIALLEAGFCNYILISYGDNSLSGGRKFLNEATHGESFKDNAAYGEFGLVSSYAMAARRAMFEFQTGPDTWKEIAVSQRKWANLNPKAMMYDAELTYEDYYNAKWVVEPFRIYDACLISDSGRALIVTSLERARDLKQSPAVIMGLGAYHPSIDIHQSDYMAGPTGAAESGKQALRMAGITIDDIQACEIYDCFTYTVEITMQDYAFFNPGEGKDWFANGRIAPGGEMPVNTSGGLLSEAYLMGLTPLAEGVMQIMGRCGERQLGPKTGTKEPEIILISDNGGAFQSHSTIILRRL